MKFKKIITAIILTGLLISCATGGSGSGGRKIPDWVNDKHSVYPDDKYLVEIGEGTSLKSAKQNGQTSLARIFRTTIKVDSTVSTRYKDLSDGKTILESQMETTSDESITQLSDETLINVHFGESWTSSEGRVYVVAYIDRMETANIYRQRIDQDATRANLFISQSEGQEDLLRRYGFLDAAIVMDRSIQALREQLEIIYQPFARAVLLPYSPEELRSLHADTAENMVFMIRVDGDENGKVGDVVAQVLNNRGFSVSAETARLSVTGRIAMEEVLLNNDYKNLRWNLFMEMRNEKGDMVVTMDEQQRETAISLQEAEARAYRSMEKVLNEKFIGALESYFDSYAGS
ncbi:hypothetical protein EXM22_16490 [Oceanispirochaeta crateris]|uniref:Lipoprotein LPP20-like domain-containing protein n=1 Tax=Oceanispirochaeta crateris TaxID=2518645 RepID=A0A5C1QR91_9SPIO|nr:LPP20 family lipoprotein [Oceanispirochaeta crateris]QEN09500.1 hypothetical protein EXM22_16490 [Oceanispirochaeta crateris]